MTKEIYNDFYNKYGVGVHADQLRFRETAKLCRGSVLDIGCGTGDLADFYTGDYLGIDISDVAVDLATESRRKDAKFEVMNCQLVNPKEIRKFDTFVIAEVLEHINDDLVL